MSKKKIRIISNGPYIVEGDIPLDIQTMLLDDTGVPVDWEKSAALDCPAEYALCRCGQSKSKPYCDGMHIQTNFTGEVAHTALSALKATIIYGENVDLYDIEPLCAAAQFCHSTPDTWEATEHSSEDAHRATAIRTACLCPSGRLTAHSKDGKAFEPPYDPSISLIEDSAHRVSGPLWVKGGIEIHLEDNTLPTRNRVTLCRCGQSVNKPYCDGTHCDINFDDGLTKNIE